MRDLFLVPKRLILATTASLASLVFALSLFAAPATGAVFVSTSGDDTADCLTLATACRTVSVAISRAVRGDAVLIASGFYTDSFTLSKPLTLIGYGPTQPAIQGFSAPQPHRVITVTAGTVTSIHNLSIQHGNASSETVPYGGGILNSGLLTISNSTISENIAAAHGGGISNLEGTLYLLDSHVTGNMIFTDGFTSSFSEVSGGGIASLTGTMVIRRSEVINNEVTPPYGPFTSGCGGGIESVGGTLAVGDSRIAGNRITLRGVGGGICNDGSLTIERSEIASNSADSGVGLWNTGQLTLTQSQVHANCPASVSAQHAPTSPEIPSLHVGGGIANRGVLVVERSAIFDNCVPSAFYSVAGGIDNESGTATLSNVTLSNNVADNSAALAGEFTLRSVTMSGNYSRLGPSIGFDAGSQGLTMQDTIIANQGQNCGQVIITSLGHNLSSDASCILNRIGDLTSTNPRLGLLLDHGGGSPTHALLAISPAIDAAGLSGCPATDQRGVARPQGAACDIGAYEETLFLHLFFPFAAR